jgi:hypothetical protein
VLQAYASWLENRVVARFDAAVSDGNLEQQAQVVAVMTQLDKERSIAQVCFALCDVPRACMRACHLDSTALTPPPLAAPFHRRRRGHHHQHTHTHTHTKQRWVASRAMFLAFAPEMLDEWLRRANREAAAAADAAEREEGDLFGEPDDLVTRQARVLARLYRCV